MPGGVSSQPEDGCQFIIPTLTMPGGLSSQPEDGCQFIIPT